VATGQELEREALEQLRRGDLEGARGTLTLLLQERPDDGKLRQRIAQIDAHLAKRRELESRVRADPAKYARAYIEARRLPEALQILRQALTHDPKNEALRAMALAVARQIQSQQTRPPSPRTPPHDPGAARSPTRAPAPEAEPPAREAEEQARIRAEAEERAREAEEQARVRAEAEGRAREAEEQARVRAEAERRAREAEEQARVRAEAERRAREAEEQARIRDEAEERARKAEEQARIRAEAEERAREAEEQARVRAEGQPAPDATVAIAARLQTLLERVRSRRRA
jgi:hypothetical protein